MIDIINPNFRVLRDDLFPFLGGGNKGRKILSIEKDILEKGCNAIVTTGGIQSNHCRAAAIMAARNRWKCTLVLHGSKELFEKESGNALLMRLSGSNIIFVEEANQIAETMDKAMTQYKEMGLMPYYIWGGGHTMEGGYAYIEAVKELKNYSTENDWYPDYIFLASGTGSTQAGIMAGLDKYNLKQTKIIGISVSRPRLTAEKVVCSFYNELCTFYGIECRDQETIVLDDYICGGYEKFDSDLYNFSQKSIKNYGFTLDTTYTGKAFYGMMKYIEKNNINNNILFWHTGGLLNFLA